MLITVSKQIKQHGSTCKYKQVTQGVYDVNTSSVVNTEISFDLKMYPKHLIATQYNFPNLIGKEVIEFYALKSDLKITPKAQDSITLNNVVYKVQSYRAHQLNGEAFLYKIVATK